MVLVSASSRLSFWSCSFCRILLFPAMSVADSPRRCSLRKSHPYPFSERPSKRFYEDDFAVLRGVEIFEEGRLAIPACLVEQAGRFVLGAGGGLDIDAARSFFGHGLLRGHQERLSDAPPLPRRVDGYPVEIEAAQGSGNRAETGIADKTILRFGKKKEIAAVFALFQTLINQFPRDRDLRGGEKPRFRNKPADCILVFPAHLGAVHCFRFLHKSLTIRPC